MNASEQLPKIEEIQTRLNYIFPEGISDRNYVVREMAARVVFVMLYINAVEETGIWLAPKHVYIFTAQQHAFQKLSQREKYAVDCMRPKFRLEGDRWFADNTREPIRDETLKEGFVAKNAVIVNHQIPTTSSKGRYALKKSFAELFLVDENDFEKRAKDWQKKYLSPAELARLEIIRSRQFIDGDVTVNFPGGESRNLSPGPSSIICKAIVEDFSKRFLKAPAVLWISESGKKVSLQDDALMKNLGLPIDQKKLLPDIVLADLGRENVLIIFVEVVYTDGPITEERKSKLLKMITDAGYSTDNVAFISAFEQRNSAPLKRRLSAIALDTLIWCMAEPDLLIWLGEEKEVPFVPSKWRP